LSRPWCTRIRRSATLCRAARWPPRIVWCQDRLSPRRLPQLAAGGAFGCTSGKSALVIEFTKGSAEVEVAEQTTRPSVRCCHGSQMPRWIAVLAFAWLWTYSPSKSFAQGGYWWYCQVISAKTPMLYYFSDTFGPAQWIKSAGGGDTVKKWMADFGAYVSHRYGEKGVQGANISAPPAKLKRRGNSGSS